MRISLFGTVLLVMSTLATCLSAAEIEPAQKRTMTLGESVGSYSSRTLVAAVEVDRDGMRLLSYTVKDRPFERLMGERDPQAYREGHSVQAEVILRGPGEEQFTQRLDIGPLCFTHPVGTEDHIAGDTIRVHRDAFIVELPEIAGFDRIDVAFYEADGNALSRRALGQDRLDSGRFTAAAGPLAYEDLAIANESSIPQVPTANDLLWPENFGDTDIYRIDGDASETNKRVNIVIVPDGYTYAQKSLMEAHADAMIAEFRNRTPYKEHDPFINYVLVYAYSSQSGTDECDCGVIKNTAMATRFPNQNPSCGHSDNRCLYYTSGCEPAAIGNITAAELRAPAQDETVLMVNTARYGGCGGARATYSAGNPTATLIAVHEVGHTLGSLADEYVSNTGCGASANGVNTSTNGVDGAWPEWIADIGAPDEGAQYWSQCVFRPQADCMMRSLGPEFCPVCNQQWGLVYFQHPRVMSSAPIESKSPGSNLVVAPGVPVDFSIVTRLGVGTQDRITWRVDAPSTPEMVVASGTEMLNYTFTEAGQHSVSVEVIADTNFIKPSRYGGNVDVAGWVVFVASVQLPGEISATGLNPFYFQDKDTVWWEEASGIGVDEYNVYRGDLTSLSSGNAGDCLLAGLTFPSTDIVELPPIGTTWFYLVAGVNAAGEGPLGSSSSGAPRVPGTPCDF